MDKVDKAVTEITSETKSNVETEMFSYDFRVKLENGEDLKFRVPSNVIMMDSPLKGYKSANGTRPMLDITNRLVYSPVDKTILRRLLIYCGISLVVGLLIGAGVMFAVGKVSPIFDQDPSASIPVADTVEEQIKSETQEKSAEVKDVKEEAKPAETKVDTVKSAEKTTEPKITTSASQDPNVIAAVRYLQESDVWNRTAMEAHAPLKGLWDALNTRSFKKILDKKYDALSGSAKFTKLRKVAKEVGSRQWNSSTYTSIGDEDITIDPYISKLERLLAPEN